jgi:hypothetical protein
MQEAKSAQAFLDGLTLGGPDLDSFGKDIDRIPVGIMNVVTLHDKWHDLPVRRIRVEPLQRR